MPDRITDDTREGFTFFRSYYEAAKELDDEQRLAFYDAIMAYALDNEEANLKGVSKSCFVLAKPVLDKSKAKSKAGTTGGQSKRQANGKQKESKPEANGKQTGSHKDKDKNKDIYPPLSPLGEEVGSKASSGESLTVAKKAGGAAEAADHSKTRTDESFNRFWEVYPRKVGRQQARKVWERLHVDDRLLDTILAAVQYQKASEQWTHDGGKYIPYPATWLNGRRWEDEITPAAGNTGKGSYAGYDMNLVQQMLDMQNEG